MKEAISAKGNATPNSMDEYISRVPEPARGSLEKVRAAIWSAVPSEATETISYGIPTGSTLRLRGLFEALQFVPDRSGRDEGVQE